jgi:hypothetical protein
MSDGGGGVTLTLSEQAILNQKEMVKYLAILASDEAIARERAVVEQQVLMSHAIEKLHSQIQEATQAIQQANEKWRGIFLGLMKIPICVVIGGAASWAFIEERISENTWLIILAVAVFPWVGDSISAVAGIFGLGKRTQ